MANNNFVENKLGRKIYFDISDTRGAHLAASDGNLNPFSLKLWNRALALWSWDLVADVGCNYGEMLVTADLPKGSRFVAFEPNPRVLPYLKRTLSELSVPVDLREYAVSDVSEDSVSFILDDDWSGASGLPREVDITVFGHNHKHSEISVAVTTLDAQFASDSLKSICIKIDVEGHENSVLDGAQELLGSLAHWAVVLEVLHMPENQILELALRYSIYFLDKQSGSLVRLCGENQQKARKQIESGLLYLQDALIVSSPLLVTGNTSSIGTTCGAGSSAVFDSTEESGYARRLGPFPRRVVYTALMGAYEKLNEQPVATISEIDFICFTDDPELVSDTWTMRLVEPRFPRDSIRSARYLKIIGPELLVGYDESLWIDNSVQLRIPPERLLDQWLAVSDFALPSHSFRESVAGEFDAVDSSGYDDPARIYEQLISYSITCPSVLLEKPYWTAFLARRHTDGVRKTMRLWYEHVLRYSRRDQLSVNYALMTTGLNVFVPEIDNLESTIHQWPIKPGRKIGVTTGGLGDALRVPYAEIGRLENALAASLLTQSGLSQALSERDLQIGELNQAVSERDLQIGELNQAVSERDLQIGELNQAMTERDAKITCLNQEVFNHGKLVSELNIKVNALVNSTSWRITAPIRWMALQHPGVSRRLHTGARISLWLATMQFAKVGNAIRLKMRFERDRRLIKKSGLFDDAYYQSQFSEPLIDPLRHYLIQGAYEGRWPHPLFDSGWYIHRNPDVRAVGANPLAHFLICWATENRWPNPYFDTGWYRLSNRDFSSVGFDPLTHYMTIGAMRMADPSQEFSTRWYLEQNKDVVKSGINPLAHFLHQGLMEGRLPCPRTSLIAGALVVDAELHCLKLSELGKEVVLFITHSPDGRLKPHVRHYLEAFKREGVDIVLIVAADQPFIDNHDWLFDLVTGLFVRENKGYDFAAWAHILRLHRRIYRAEILYLVNDSLLGPTNDAEFHTLIKRVRSSSADIIGLTENEERGWHLQSYFLAIKRGALASFAFHRFIVDIVAYDDKDHVINFYEVKFAPAMKAAGLITEALFASRSIHNQTIYHWRELLAEGFPFLKVMTARDDIPNVDKSGWRDELARHGYDVRLADQLMSDIAVQRDKRAEASCGPLWKSVEPGEAPKEVPHVVFIGPNAFNNGLGVAARSYITALMHTDFQTNILPVKRPFHVHHRVAPAIDVYDFVGPADVALVHLNPNESPISVLLDQQQLDSIESALATIGVFVWESPQLPDYFVKALNNVDAVWAPSQYCADVFRAATNVQVDVIPYVVPIRKSLSSSTRQMALRNELKLVANERVILYAFDASSYLVRKNPMALARAYERSGLASKGWRLVFKTKLLSPKMKDGAELLNYCNATIGITILNRAMNNDEICALMDLADIYASSHCSEGFGLTIAEAMARGKPVVATDYGGSRDFLSTDCGFPVRCTEWVLEEDFGAYLRGTSWGLVDEAHLAESLVAAASLDDEARVALAERARQKIRETLSPEAVATRMQASVARLLGKAH